MNFGYLMWGTKEIYVNNSILDVCMIMLQKLHDRVLTP